MRCSAYEGCQEGRDLSVRFFFSIGAGRAERNGVERSRARQRRIFDDDRSRLSVFGSVRNSFPKSFFSFFLLFLRPLLRAVSLRLCPIGVTAFSCVGLLAPRTSSYPDS